MKKITLLILTSVSFLLCYGQNSQLLIGFEINPVLTKVKSNLVPTGSKINLSGGFYVEYFVKPKVSVKTGISYQRYGIIDDVGISNVSAGIIGQYKIITNYDYLAIPVLIKIIPWDNTYFLNSGFTTGVLLRQETEINPPIESYYIMWNVIPDFRFINLWYTLGGGYIFTLSDKLMLSTEIRGNLGIINQEESPVKARANSIGFVLGINYKIR